MREIKFCKGNFYHIYNRGVEKRDIFNNDNDRWRFLQGLALFNNEKTSLNVLWQMERQRGRATLKVLKEFFVNSSLSRNPLVRILAYCLMPNHFHLLIEEIVKDGISRFMQKIGVGYTRYFNNKHERVGSLFQGTFKAALADKEDYLKYLLAYINVVNPGQLIEPNLKEKGAENIKKVLEFAGEYIWSTNLEYVGKRNSIIIEKGIFDRLFTVSEYINFTKAALAEKKFTAIDDILLD